MNVKFVDDKTDSSNDDDFDLNSKYLAKFPTSKFIKKKNLIPSFSMLG